MPPVNPGLFYGALAFVGWGLYPLFFRELAAVTPLEIILHRALWSVLAVALPLAVLARWSWLGPLLRSPQQMRMVLLGAVLIGANWLIYVWAVSEHRVVEASLGYFINPIVNVALGVAVLGERLRPVQWTAVALAAAGVVWLTATAGALPWIALALALLFALYGLVRKTAALGALEGLAAETALMAVVAVPLLAWWTFTQPGAALAQVRAGGDAALLGWLVLTGPVTVLPLLGFAAAATAAAGHARPAAVHLADAAVRARRVGVRRADGRRPPGRVRADLVGAGAVQRRRGRLAGRASPRVASAGPRPGWPASPARPARAPGSWCGRSRS